MGKRLCFSICFIMFCCTVFGQPKYSADMDFLITKIKTVYAGYKKNKEFNSLVEKLSNNKSTDSFAVLSKLTSFFNDLHLVLYDYKSIKIFDPVFCEKQKQELIAYLNDKKILKNKFEGYWQSELGNCIIGLRKVSDLPLTYKGYVVETTSKAIPGYCILELTETGKGYYYTDYKEEGLAYRIILRSKFKGSNTLLVNSYGKWSKLNVYDSGNLAKVKAFGYKPEFRRIDSATVVLKLPDFGGYNIKRTDSIIIANEKSITSAKTLILDIRNNMGGTIRNYLSLVPYVCNNDIIRSACYQLCSNDIIEDVKSDIIYYAKKKDTLALTESKNNLAKMENNFNKFLYLKGDTLFCSYKQNNIQHVAIIANNICLSAAELMILDFKQSSKVKIFGETTGGAVDNLDALKIDLPSEKYTLFVATSKRSLTATQPAYDGIGIKPDIVIPDNNPDWIGFVKKYYEKK